MCYGLVDMDLRVVPLSSIIVTKKGGSDFYFVHVNEWVAINMSSLK
jgi:hypothetical protein